MAIHFSEEELAQRRQRTIDAMVERNLDGMLIFRQESMFYLTGYDTFGYVFFQCLYLGADGKMTLLTRSADLRQAKHTSIIDDVRVWVDGPDATPELELRKIIDEHGGKDKTFGVELEAYGLTARSGRRLYAALDCFCRLEDASDLVSKLRVIKSPAELGYVRQAAELADNALREANQLCVPGAFEGDILAAMQGAVFKGGGDYPSNEFIIGSGQDALLCRYFTGRRHLDKEDQITLEWAGAYRHYHAAMMRTIVIGTPSLLQIEMHKVATDAMAACMETLKPGVAVGEVFDAYAHVVDAAGMQEHRLNATGYSLGATFAPNWMDWPMFYHDNPVVVEENMVFFLHMILMDSDNNTAMCPGQTVAVTKDGCQNLSKMPLDLISNS
ncbi:MAG: Xaa-Pro peptidase family protein [Halopseudomonas aestusnigri]